jgi:hypothetical protein
LRTVCGPRLRSAALVQGVEHAPHTGALRSG